MSQSFRDHDRRHFLCVLGAAGVAASSVTACGDDAMTMTAQPFVAGRVADHPQGLFKLYGARKVIVGRDAMGFFAMSIVCPHEGFDVQFVTPGGSCMNTAGCTSSSMDGALVCSSQHGGRFDANGVRTAGPPRTGLPHYQVTVRAGEITVNPTVTVDAATRSMG